MNDLRVLPLRPGTNRPWLTDWPNRASADPRQIKAWRSEFPGCNWGILTGNGLGVLDLDTKNAPQGDPGGFGSLIDIEELLSLDLSELPMVTTANGLHLYFRYEGHLPTKIGWVPHLDVKADGGHQVAGPGTVRDDISGVERTYTLVRGSLRDIPHAPDALLSAIRGWRVGRPGTGGSPSPGGELPGTAEAVAHGLPVNSRNDYMHRLACRWWRDFGLADEGRVWALARDVWEATPGHDTFPWSEAEVAVKSAHRFVALEAEKDLTAISAILKNWSRS